MNGTAWATSAGNGTTAGAITAFSNYSATLGAAGDAMTTNNDVFTAAGTTTLTAPVTINSLVYNSTGMLDNGGNNIAFNGPSGGLLITAGGGSITDTGVVGAGPNAEFIANVATGNTFTISASDRQR